MILNSIFILKVQDYRDWVLRKADVLILQGFPKKIAQMNALLASKDFAENHFESVKQHLPPMVPPKQPERNQQGGHPSQQMQPSQSFSCNPVISNTINYLKPLVRNLVMDANLLKMWINFMIPKVEGGGNFGVSIQLEILNEIKGVEADAFRNISKISNYYSTRADLVSRMRNYYEISDYRRGVEEFDEKEFLDLWLTLSNVRNHYCVLYDLITKNLEHLKKPRNSNAMKMY